MRPDGTASGWRVTISQVSRAKIDRLDTELLMHAFLGRLRGGLNVVYDRRLTFPA
jgi:hypothetical protein